MLRRLIVISLFALLVAGLSSAADAPWFDFANCSMCKVIGQNPEMMKSISWEQHDISNGIVCVTTVPDKYLDAYRAAHESMAEIGARLMKGEQMYLCGSCQALGKCLAENPHQEYAQTDHGDVWILTSDNPEVVAALQEWAKRSTEEMAKMTATPAPKTEG
jgi:hypothetical protein